MGQRGSRKLEVPWNLTLPLQSLHPIRMQYMIPSPGRILCLLCHTIKDLALCPLPIPQEDSSVKKPINNHPTYAFYF